jgi:hypothetical protein
MRAECHDRLSIANGCSRDVVLSHVSAIQKKRRELSILIDTKLPLAPMPRYKNPVSKNESGILSQKMLFPPCKVFVDFFFDEEERRYAITRRQRKEHKKRRETRPRKSKLSVLEPPLSVLSQLFSFIQSAMREERYKNRFVSI